MNGLKLIAGLALATAALGAQASGLIADRASVTGVTQVLDFEADAIEGNVIDGTTFAFSGVSMSANAQFTVGQNVADLAENGIWGAGNHFLSFDKVGSMTLNISFNGQTTSGLAFDYSVYDADADGSAYLKVRYYDAAGLLIKGYNLGFTPFGATTYDQFQSIGYLSDSANIARVSITGDGVVLDNLTFTQPVPEPESYAMLLAGLGLLGFAARRKARA